MMKKKVLTQIIATVLSLAMLLSAAPLSALAEALPDTNVSVGETTDPEITEDGAGEDGEDEDLYADAIEVYDSEGLEEALNLGASAIEIMADFLIDRTFYVTNNAIIFSEEKHTLTRAPEFSGDMFIVGENAEGTLVEGGVELQVGHHESETGDLLIIDGNKDNMTVDVTGTVFYVCKASTAVLYHNLTVQNCYKNGNEKTLVDPYDLSYREQIGGPVAIVVGGKLNVYGGNYSHNSTNTDDTASSRGGVFYLFGNANIYGGTFEDNHAYRAGAFYSYRKLNIYGGTIKGNTAGGPGGAIYMPASTAAYIVIDGDEDEVGFVQFRDNIAGSMGGAIYAAGVSVNVDTAVFSGNSAKNMGGGIYITGSKGYFENVVFDSNKTTASATDYGGGAIHAYSSTVEINGAEIKNNVSQHNGGGIVARETSEIVLNEITASNNTAAKSGGFVLATASSVKLYSSSVYGNSAANGGGVYVGADATIHAYLSNFDSNSAVSNGGALFVYTGAVESVLHSCVLLDNTCGNFGGGMYVSSASILKVYNMTAKNNSALKGGFMYHTTTNTTVTLNGLTVEGNTATEGGPIIWGNLAYSILYINKTTYYDVDATTAYDDAYWTYAIANKLKVYETTDPIPGFVNYGDTEETPPESIVNPNVTNIIELQRALSAGLGKITVISDIKLDRPLYANHSTTITVSGNRTFTRHQGYGGDLFVIGQNGDGTLCEDEVKVIIKTLDAESSLTIDGNKDNMTVDVIGTVFFVCKNGVLEINEGITVKNCKKVGNERTLDEIYELTHTAEIGGPVFIVAKGQLNIYGGTFTDNTVNDKVEDDETSSRGGVVYSFGKVNIYGGYFGNNHAHRGGALYVYDKMYIYNATIENNTANIGGAVYIPASTGAYLYLGGATSEVEESRVIFRGNESAGSGGAIYATGRRFQIENSLFTENTAVSYGGAVYVDAIEDIETATTPGLNVKDSVFEKNTSVRGGAIYMTSTLASVQNTDFISNHSTGTSHGGGAIYSATNSRSVFESVRFTDNISDYNGGGILLYSGSDATLYNVTATGNKAESYGGFLYSNSALKMYNSVVKNNEATKQAGALYLTTDSTTAVYSTDFIGNKANGGGAIRLCNGSDGNLIQDCRFIDNSSTYYGGAIYLNGTTTAELYNITATGNHGTHGGFLYQTTAGSLVTINGLTVSGNSDDNGGPTIWGNTFNAKLHINKINYEDKDETGALDDAYWAKAIYNKLTVTEITSVIPEADEYGDEDYSNITDYVSVSSAEELEEALLSEKPFIRVVSDIVADRSFFVTADTTLFATTPYRITRATDFGGDIFVVGEYKNGRSVLLDKIPPVLTLGNPESATENLLIIDGNKNNVTVPVVGSLIMIVNSAKVNMYANTSLVNAHKEGNERTMDTAKYALPASRHKIGGSAVLLESGTLNIYGGIIRNNSARKETAATETDDGLTATFGSAIYNHGALNIYDGTFEYNKGARGGAIFNYKLTHVYGGTFDNNYASRLGGAIYMPSSAQVHLYIGDETGESDKKVIFKNNTSYSGGGAIYSGLYATTVIYGNTEFSYNQSKKSSGGAIYSSGVLLATDSVFKNNSSYSKGGALYVFNAKADFANSKVVLENCTFSKNNARSSGGAIAAASSSTELESGTVLNITDSSFTSNTANNGTAPAVSGGNGGALYISNKSVVTVKNSTFNKNSTGSEGGAVYMALESTLNLTDCEFTGNTATNETKSYAGAISVHSSFVNADRVTFTGNSAVTRAGALYSSYNSASSEDSIIKLRDCDFTNNYAASYGGAIYSTDRNRQTDPEGEPEQQRGLYVFDTTFTGNSTGGRGGAMYMSGLNNVYMQTVEFTGNQAQKDDESSSYGGAIYMTGKNIMEINGGIFTDNTADVVGGIGLYSGSSIILNKVTATGNSATNSYGGFLACDTATAKIFDCVIENNSSFTAGGGIYTVDLSNLSVYNTTFKGNSAETSGGAIHVYTGASNTVLHGCDFQDNKAVVFGGAVNISGSSLLDMYNVTARNNQGGKGGFMYETKAGTVVNINGLTVSGNTALEGGPIIWGNTLNAKLYLNKDNYVDEDVTALDDAYWASAIVNLLTVYDLEGEIPAEEEYECSYEEEIPTVPSYKEIDVDKIFALSENSSDEPINSTYAKLPKLDNSSNFMSKNTAVYENINGGTVTADSFVSYKNSTEGNGTFGEGMLVFQAMQYKKAHPEENVKIHLASYRFSAATAICINRNSRYFGYMRALHLEEYDQYGFVRVSYLLKAAAAMGIEVTITTQLNGYPNTPYTPLVPEYFTEGLTAPCDQNYAPGKVLGDYLNFVMCEWSLIGKGGSDMMHTKACAVSHYLDMNGVAHKNATWFSSTNLDGINSNGTNGNNNLQTSTIISDHEDIYRVTVNHIEMVTEYCGYEEVYLFRDLAIKMSTEQIDLILAGREAEIPADDQIVYLGSETDSVFELYFTPMGGEMHNWDEEHNPYSKYLRKLSNSEDSIQVIWNCVKFGEYSLRNQMQDVIIDSFHKNKDADNRIYLNLPTFNTEAFDDLKVGEDIGYTSFNKMEFGGIHTKDLSLSYTENGQRFYVSLLNSLNTHGGSSGYQTNFVLVVKETELTEDSVYFTMADLTATGMVEHAYGEEKYYLPDNSTEDGYKYHECAECGKIKVTGVVHRASTWTVDKKATMFNRGVAHKTCLGCGILLETREYSVSEEEIAAGVTETSGKTFTQSVSSMESVNVSSTPLTLEAVIKVPKTCTDRGGVVVGNYDKNSSERLNLEIYTFGKVRLFYTTNGQSVDCIFGTDIRSSERTHIAVTIDGSVASLYVDGRKVETASLPIPAPNVSGEFKVGGDNRDYNTQYFRGTIYSVNLFSDVRSEDEIKRDAVIVFPDSDSLMVSKYFEASGTLAEAVMTHGTTFNYETLHSVEKLGSTPKTIEAVISVPETYKDRAGVIFGNYNGTADGINLEVYNEGKLRLYLKNGTNAATYLFDTDIRSDEPTHIAVTLGETVATLYLDGEAVETKEITVSVPNVTENFVIGGDNRDLNSQYFKGSIYSVSLFDDVRTADEIKKDIVSVSRETEGFLYSKAFVVENDLASVKVTEGIKFKHYVDYPVGTLSSTPKTIEAVISVPETYTDRAGVIVGNYEKSSVNRLNLEIYSDGRVRLFYTNNGTSGDCIFDTDIRSAKPVHIAVTVDGLVAKLYVDGALKEEKMLSIELGAVTENFKLGGDNRLLNTQYFKGTLYSVNMFSDVRSAEEILSDVSAVSASEEGLIFSKRFINKTETETVEVTTGGKTFLENGPLDIGKNLSKTPNTIEAVVKVPMSIEGAAGVIVGNNNGTKRAQMNLEIIEDGRVRLYYMATNGVKTDTKFSADIRSDDPVHIAVTIVGKTANLYINGVLSETKKLNYGPGKIVDLWKIGGDNTPDNPNYFKGTVYAVHMFSDARTEEEIKRDIICPDILDTDILYTAMFDENSCDGDDHVASDWLYDYDATDEANGISHKECVNCGKILECYKTPKISSVDDHRVFENAGGFMPDAKHSGDKITTSFDSTPLTFEASIQLDKDYSYRGGVIMGNYDAVSKNAINIDVFTYGKPRIYYVVNGTGYSFTFNTDIRSDEMIHLAITVDGLKAKLYINGVLKEEGNLNVALPETTEGYIVGADGRKNGPQYFKGTIYTAAMFSDVRTAEEIAIDRYLPASDSDNLLFSKSYLTSK